MCGVCCVCGVCVLCLVFLFCVKCVCMVYLCVWCVRECVCGVLGVCVVCVCGVSVCVLCVFFNSFIQPAPLQCNTTCFFLKFYYTVTSRLIYITSISTIMPIELYGF